MFGKMGVSAAWMYDLRTTETRSNGRTLEEAGEHCPA